MIWAAEFGKNISHDALQFPVLYSLLQVLHKQCVTESNVFQLFGEQDTKEKNSNRSIIQESQ